MSSNQKKSLLLVDDESAIGLIIQIQFSKDYNITVLKNGMDAIQWLLDGNIPDLIVLDLNMPEMNGLQFLKEVRKYSFFKSTPMIVLSGEESSSKRIEAFASGANDYITKPFNPVELRVRMERFLQPAA
jgi:two-component system, chemotaxis family, chemotaxis protein CheY